MPDSIRFDVFNPQKPDAGPVIYISDDAAKWGRLTITLTNQSADNSDIKLTPDGVLKIYLEMLTPDDIKTIKLADGSPWAGGPDATNRHLEFHPKSTITVPSQSSITIELHNVLGKTPRQGKFRFYDETLGIRNAVVQGFVQRPPGDAANQWDLACVLDARPEYQDQGDTVYVTSAGQADIANYLLVHLYRSAGGTLPSTGTPQLSFSFLTGAGDLALCSEDRLKKVTASLQNQLPAGRWKDPAVDAQGEDTVWAVAPADGGGDLFPEEGLLIVRFDSIVTDLPPGDSILFIQYAGLAGYDDGTIQVPLSKSVPVPYVRYFRAKANGKEVGANATIDYAALTLEWDVFAADSCLLQGDDEPKAKTVALVDSKPLVPRPFQSYTLQPQVGSDALPGQEVRFSVTPAVPDLTTGLDASWVSTLWRCFGTAADNRGQFFDEGNLVADVALTLTEQFNGVEMLSTGMQTHSAQSGLAAWYEIQRPGGDTANGGIEATVLIGPPVVRWNCRNGDYCVLYANEAKVADRLALTGERQASLSTTYRIECVGAGTRSATATTSANPLGAATFVVSCGANMTITWSATGAESILVEAGPSIVGTSSSGTFSEPAGASRAYDLTFTASGVQVELMVWRPGFVP